jgi:hypothetical protein
MNLTELSDADLLALSEGCTILDPSTTYPHTCLGCQAVEVYHARQAAVR